MNDVRDAWDATNRAAAAAGVRVFELDALRDTPAVNTVIARVWGEQFASPELLRAMQHAGCVLYGASDGDGEAGDGAPLVGFVLGFVGIRDGLHLHSHMLAVVPERRSGGVGAALKLAQRAWALDAGIAEVRWTFDPMLLANARFNLLKLGAVAVRFLPNFYGEMADELNRGERTDRFELTWPVGSDRVEAALSSGSPPTPAPDGAVALLDALGDPSAPEPSPTGRGPGDRALVAIPPNHMSLRRERPELAAAWRDAAAEAFAACFDHGLSATAVTNDGRYLFERWTP